MTEREQSSLHNPYNKTVLQQICQKRKLPLPTYKTEQVGKERGNKILWQATVSSTFGQFKSKIYYNKKHAEADCAEKVLKYIEEQDNKITKFVIENKTLILIDGENLPNFISEIDGKINLVESDVEIKLFITSAHALAQKETPSKTELVVINSTRRDSVDTCLQVYCGFLLSTKIYEKIYIATKDHFGDSLVELLNSNQHMWDATNALVVINGDDILTC